MLWAQVNGRDIHLNLAGNASGSVCDMTNVRILASAVAAAMTAGAFVLSLWSPTQTRPDTR